MKKILYTILIGLSSSAFSINTSDVITEPEYFSIESSIQSQPKLSSDFKTRNFKKMSFDASASTETTNLINVYQNKSVTVFEYNKEIRKVPMVVVISGKNDDTEVVNYTDLRYGETTLLIINSTSGKYKVYDEKKPFDGYFVYITN